MRTVANGQDIHDRAIQLDLAPAVRQMALTLAGTTRAPRSRPGPSDKPRRATQPGRGAACRCRSLWPVARGLWAADVGPSGSAPRRRHVPPVTHLPGHRAAGEGPPRARRGVVAQLGRCAAQRADAGHRDGHGPLGFGPGNLPEVPTSRRQRVVDRDAQIIAEGWIEAADLRIPTVDEHPPWQDATATLVEIETDNHPALRQPVATHGGPASSVCDRPGAPAMISGPRAVGQNCR